MRAKRLDESDTETNQREGKEGPNDLNIKLERRRRIEDIVEEKRLREALDEFDLSF
ncbi:MAG: hypothetical protein WC785_02650 [Tatlockia sp.]|jgi:hypothetical protein